MKLGKQPARVDRRTVLFKDVAPALPQPIDLIDWYGSRTDWLMMDNDRLGNCTCAAIGHAEQTITRNCVGVSEFDASNNQVDGLYQTACGYDPRDPSTDRGGVALDVLKTLSKQGVFGNDQLLGYAAVDAQDTVRVRQAIAAFGGVYVGLQLPDSVVHDDLLLNSWELTGKIAPSPYNGHMVWTARWDVHRGPCCITWGAEKWMSPGFWSACVDEVWVLLFKNWLAQYGELADVQTALENVLRGVSN